MRVDLHGLADDVEDPAQLVVVLVGALGDLGPAMQVGDALAQREPRELGVGPSVILRAQDLERLGSAMVVSTRVAPRSAP